jgi:hypothetical protein
MMTPPPSVCTLRAPPLSGMSAGLQSIDLWFEGHTSATLEPDHTVHVNHTAAPRSSPSPTGRAWRSPRPGPGTPATSAGSAASTTVRVTLSYPARAPAASHCCRAGQLTTFRIGAARFDWRPSPTGTKPVIEFITAPNNPDGALRSSQVRAGARVHNARTRHNACVATIGDTCLTCAT